MNKEAFQNRLESNLSHAEKVRYFKDKINLDDDGWCPNCKRCHKRKGSVVEVCGSE